MSFAVPQEFIQGLLMDSLQPWAFPLSYSLNSTRAIQMILVTGAK
jgi:hypothetical protein